MNRKATIFWLFLMGVFPVWADVQSIPTGALAYYDFGDPTITASIPNLLQSGDPSRPGSLTIRGTDFRISDGEMVWNENIGNFTFIFPFDANRGTFAETLDTFPNSFGSGGTMAVRLRLDPSVPAQLGQASSMGLISFRPVPDPNIHRVVPRGLEFHREGRTDPLHFLVREGNNSIGHNSEFNDEVRSSPLLDPTAEMTAIVVWDPQTLRIYVGGVLSGENLSRVTTDHPTPDYRIMVAVQPGLIHSGDNQFYKGAIKTLVLYDRPLDIVEVGILHQALNSTVPPPPPDASPPAAPGNLRVR